MAAMEVQQALDLVQHEPVEVQDEFAALLLEKLHITSSSRSSSSRRWSATPLLCWRAPATGSACVPTAEGGPPESRQLQRALRAVTRQSQGQQHQQAVEALEHASLALRLRSLPLDVRLLAARSMGRSARRLCHAFLHAYGPLQCGLRLEDTDPLCTFHEQMSLGASAPHLSQATALVLGPRTPLPDDPPTVRTLSDLQAAALRTLPRLASLTLLPGAAPTDELLSALAPLARHLTALTLPCLPQLTASDPLRPLTLLRSLTLTPHAPDPAAAPAPVNPHALLGPLRRLRHLRALHLRLYPTGAQPPPDPTWLPTLTTLSALTALTLSPWMAPCHPQAVRALHHSWPSLAALSLTLALPDEAPASEEATAQALAAALAARRGLTSLRLRLQDGAGRLPLQQALAPLTALAELSYGDPSWSDRQTHPPPAPAADEVLAAVAGHGALTRLVLHAPLYAASGAAGREGSCHSGSSAATAASGSSSAGSRGAGSASASSSAGAARGRDTAALPQPLPQLAGLAGRLVELEVGVLPGTLQGTLAAVVPGCLPSLRHLRLLLLAPLPTPNPWDSATVSLVARLTHLAALRLSDERHLPGCVVPAVARLTALQSLSLASLHRGTRDSPRLQGSHLKPLAALASLTALELVGFHDVRGRALGLLRRLPRLEGLRLEGMPEVELFCHKLSVYLVPLPPALRLLQLHTVALSAEARDELALVARQQDCRLVVERCWLKGGEE